VAGNLIKRKSKIAWLLLVAAHISFAQVENNNIVNRSSLVLDADYSSSSTNQATVEWSCVNKALTKKCIDYHNDQWFSFSVPQPGKYFLNISAQACRDGRGVQAIVIEGNPCEISTYKILQCIPKISQHDVFIELDSLKPDLQYLVNIDGFLGDYCNFNIQLSSRHSGLSLAFKNLDTLNLSVARSREIVTLNWNTPQAMANEIVSFEIYRSSKGSNRSSYINRVPIALNSVGQAQTQYSLNDTLSAQGTYSYAVLGLFKDGQNQLLDQKVVSFYSERPAPRTLYVQLNYKKGTKLQILLLDKKRDKVLKQSSLDFKKEHDTHQRIYVDDYLDRGIQTFIVRVVNLKTQEKVDYEFVLSTEGKMVRK
jgi:hypothetical protein